VALDVRVASRWCLLLLEIATCRYGTYRVLYRVNFYPRAHLGPTIKIEGHGPRWFGLQAVKTDLVEILGKLDSVIDLELLNCIRLGLELHPSLLSLYKERLGAPLIQTIYNHNAKANADWTFTRSRGSEPV
jgi:hypothetical protein